MQKLLLPLPAEFQPTHSNDGVESGHNQQIAEKKIIEAEGERSEQKQGRKYLQPNSR